MQTSVYLSNVDFNLNYSYPVNLVDTSNGNIIITLDEIANYYGDGVHFYISKTSNDSNTITFNCYSGELFYGNSSYVMTTNKIHIMCNNLNWYILS